MELTMKDLTNKWRATVALVALFGLASCSQVPVDNGGSSGGSDSGSGGSSSGGSGGGYGSGSGGSSSGGSGGGYGSGSGGSSSGGSGGGYGSGSGGSSSGGSGGGIAQGFVVQLLATSSASKASSIKNTFVNEGYNNTSVNAILRSGQTLHRVQIGPFGTQADAQRVLNQMKRRYKKNQYVNSAVVKTIYGR